MRLLLSNATILFQKTTVIAKCYVYYEMRWYIMLTRPKLNYNRLYGAKDVL